MKTKVFSTLFTLLMVQFGIAQNIRAKIVDEATGDAVPYANIRVNESENLVSNGEGYFSLSENNSQDETLLTISYLGYVNQQLTVNALKNQISPLHLRLVFLNLVMLMYRTKNQILMKSWLM
ncbi:hypothetical protein HNQ02_001016 [Flavobacterium sp. 7E]|uniref:carboxypeptidase-like regulatory domain-containing protein n=1 Tax=Flavobacterium sp. 7E TaxID=2735898 RepID=UPI0020C6881E|nr:carboxypeptidase-like regulatory domain-containing protein [Flavobacterium sp. 7E]NRS88102.1 hypothetical protein [Flavobacterium sp. 7E]